MKIILIQSGPAYEILLLSSVLIGLKKRHPKAKILWVGEPEYFSLVKFNKRVSKCLNIHKSGDLVSLTNFYGSDICYNSSLNREAQKFAIITGASCHYGFKDGPVNRNALLLKNVMSGQAVTRKTILDLYYSLANMKWKGEGYGLSYYPKTKQTKNVGAYCHSEQSAEKFKLPKDLLNQFDTINQFSHIITDDLFVLHASLALRKKVTFTETLPYNLNF
ncbi:hypothetical protein LCGC14_1357100 [marine sediment metagenome]|uniref:Polysaccharide pyruvyl transferase domain-containing protein n=1 Tax=marine sediment metagenome TaxID=412755 RepID=A0A0F9K9T5_9ZZZZ